MDPVLLEVYRHRFAGIADEMGVTLQRTSFSPNIKERLDFSCALFDAGGGLIAQAAHIPVHLGAMPASVEKALEVFATWEQGDVAILNDPYAGGTHLPDITMVTPVFSGGSEQPLFFLATRAHHADVGGMTPGSLPLSTEIYQEGVIIPPVKWYRAGVSNDDLMALILRNVRTPEERKGDFSAQLAAHAVGEKRLHELIGASGGEEVRAYAAHLQSYSERLIRHTIANWPDGSYTSQDHLELLQDDEELDAILKLRVTVQGDEVTFDFEGSSEVLRSSLNAVLSITRSACYYVVACLVEEDIPMNKGCFTPVHVKAPLGTVVNAIPPAGVAGGNVETSQRVVDVALKALARVVPGRVPAASQGTMNNLTIGGLGIDGIPYAYYETIGGGMGASPVSDGVDGVHVHMSNTLNTPVEALEMAFPFRIIQYALAEGMGGEGKHRGGRGLVREYELLRDATVTMLSERRRIAPWGLAGGQDGSRGRNVLVDRYGAEVDLPPKFSRTFRAGERLRVITPGGGGYGKRDVK